MKRLILNLAIICCSIGQINTSITKTVIDANTSTSKELFDAIEAKSLKKVKKILKNKNLDINALNSNKETALDVATKKELTKIAGRLLQNGAKVTSEDNAYKLIQLLNDRANKFFWGGLFLSPLLWIGSISAATNKEQIQLLIL